MEIEELRAEVRRGEQRLRTANRDMKSMQVHGGRSRWVPDMSACIMTPSAQAKCALACVSRPCGALSSQPLLRLLTLLWSCCWAQSGLEWARWPFPGFPDRPVP